MTAAAWLAILATFIVAVMSPGPDFLAVLRTSLTQGRRAGFGVGAGIAVGTAAWIAVTLLGVVALINAHPAAFFVVKVAGAIFLTVYGLRILVAVLRLHPEKADAPPTSPLTPAAATAEENQPVTAAVQWARAFRLGLLTNTVGNPKALVFFSSLFATMVPATITLWQSLTLGVVMVVLARAWFALVATVASTGEFMRGYQRLQRPLDLALGILFVSLGLALLLPW